MKRLLGLLLILLLLSGGAYYLVQKNEANKKGIVTADRGFTVESIDVIQKIVIKHKKLQPMIFTKNGKGWMLNGKYPVDPGVFVNVEKVLTDMRMLYIPPASHTKTIMKSIENNGIQVDLYDGDELPFKIFYIGSDVQKSAGTHMILAGATQPYVMHLPGLNGGLRSRFEQPVKNYRDKFIYQFPEDKIANIKLEYPKDNFSSFILEKHDNKWQVSPLLDMIKKETGPLNLMRLNAFIAQFENMGTEGLIPDLPEKDSVISKVPSCIFTLTNKDGSVHQHKYYSYDDFINRSGNARTPEELRAENRVFILTEDNDLYTAQNRVVGDIFLGYKDFYANVIAPKSK